MERLTQKCILGGWTALVPKQEVVDRLASYEDIGLEPEEIPLVAEMQRQLEAYLAIGTVEHLTELCKAEQQRREGCEYCDNHAYVIHIQHNVPAHMNYCYACGRDLRGESHD